MILFLTALLLIFGLTMQNSVESGKLSQRVQQALQKAAEKAGIDAVILHVSNHTFRKYDHTAEFLLLGIAAALLFRRGKDAFLKALLLCMVISLADQTLKLLVPGREFDWTDYPYDAVGYFVGTGVSAILRKIIAGKAGKILNLTVSKRKNAAGRDYNAV